MVAAIAQSLLRSMFSHPKDRLAVTDGASGASITYGELAVAGCQYANALARLGLRPGDPLVYFLDSLVDLFAVLAGSAEAGVKVFIASPDRETRTSVMWGVAQAAKLIVAPWNVRTPPGTPRLSHEEFRVAASAETGLVQGAGSATAAVSVATAGAVDTMTFDALIQSVTNFQKTCAVSGDDVLLSASSPLDLEGLCASFVTPMLLGMHVLRPGSAAGKWVPSLCELPAEMLLQLSQGELPITWPERVRLVVCGSGRLTGAQTAQVEQALALPIHQGYGTKELGFWAASKAADQTSVVFRPVDAQYAFSIRHLRSPLRFFWTAPEQPGGEIVLRSGTDAHGTGDVGWLTPGGDLVVEGRLADVAVRAGHAILLSEIDTLLQQHEAVRSSTTFREHGTSPAERIITVCASDAGDEDLRAWLATRLAPYAVPDRIVTYPILPTHSSLPVRIQKLRAIANGTCADAVLAAVTARRFRRSPPYNAPGFLARVQDALLQQRPLNFLIFWGCGPRREVISADRVAIDALQHLLEAVECVGDLAAHVNLVCTDLHATNNGHSRAHYSSYFNQVEAAAADLNITSEWESAVWHRGGLTAAHIERLKQEPDFEARWQSFPLRDRFIQQASRHSSMRDKTSAARHYYATCLLERDLLKNLYPDAIFLTYNGPEFNECFPDLPTLYIYPGPRGRTDKPWFVHQSDSITPQAAAE